MAVPQGSLHTAARTGNAPQCLRLLDAGLDANLRDAYQSTPLHYSAHAGHAAVCRLLMAKGGDVNAFNDNKATALHYAVRQGYIDVCEVLLKDPNMNVNVKAEWEATPILYAAEYGHILAVRLLLRAGAQLNVLDSRKCTPLVSRYTEHMFSTLNNVIHFKACCRSRGARHDLF
jgi:ankyrin repeat protein